MQGTQDRTLAGPARASRQSDEVSAVAERLLNRLSGTLSNLTDLRERISGSRPPESSRGEQVATAFVVGGFVGSTGQALERAHAIVGDIEETLANIADVI